MKKFIYKTNQFLLERYPTIWNTRIVWMLLSALTLHIIFFVFGFVTLTNPVLLQDYNIKDIFFDNGTIFLTTIISILLLVGWLVYMFKNNAFKNFYPTKRSTLFGQFLCYLLIIFSCSSFYLSYNYGIKAYIATTYPTEQTNKEIEVANDAALFLSENLESYTLNNRRFPKPFYELYCEKFIDFIDYSQPHQEFLNESYQYYSLNTKEVPLSERQLYVNKNESYTGSKLVFSKVKDSTVTLYYKDSVVDISAHIKTAAPSYYNYSSTFFISRNDTLKDSNYNLINNPYSYEEYEYNNYSPTYSLRHQLRNQRNHTLLNRNNPDELKALLQSFLSISDAYKIPHNLNVNSWFDLIYHPNNFEVKNFIRTERKNEYSFQVTDALEQTKFEKFFSDYLTDSFYKNDALHNVFENIEDIKASNPFMESIHLFMWFTFFFSCIIFMFRVTGLKPLLFSVITTGVLALIISLASALLFYIISGSSNDPIYAIMYLTFIIGSIILAIPICFADKIKKGLVAICVNISIIGFALYLFLIIGIISMHQQDACENDPNYYNNGYNCDTLIESLELNWSYVLFFVAVIFIFFYSSIIKKWKSLPEG